MSKLNSYLTFQIGEEYFAANVKYVHNIIEIPMITQVPEMPQYMLGVTNLRGKVLPVIDSRIKMGVKNTEFTTNTCIIVMEVNIDDQAVFMGLLVDAVSEVIEMDEQQIKEAPEIGNRIKSSNIVGVIPDDEKFIMVLKMENVLSEDILKIPA